jgi:hypothetical protein
MASRNKSGDVTLVELVFEWVLPVVGAMATALLASTAGLSTGVCVLLALPGGLCFQWAVAGLLVLLHRTGVGRKDGAATGATKGEQAGSEPRSGDRC